MRKIEVPSDTPSQFELGDTAADIERKRRERGERDERDRIEQEERDRERMERERREDSQEREEKRVQTDTDTDVESTQSRQKKGQMKSIFLCYSDKEAIVEFVKQHEELYDKTNDSFKDKQKKERLWEQVAATRNLPVKIVKKWFDTQRTRYGKLTQLPEASQATAGCEYILTIPETQPVSIPVMQPTQTATGEPVTVIAKVQQPPRPSSASAQPTSYVALDDQQSGTSRELLFNPALVAPSQQEESSSGLSSLFAAIPSVPTHQQMDTPQSFSPSQLQPAPSPVPYSTHHEQSRPPSQSSQQSQSQPKSADQPAQVAPNRALFRATRNVEKQSTSYMSMPKNKKAHHPTLTPPHSTQKSCVNE